MYWHQGCVNTATVSIRRDGAKVQIQNCEGANTYFKNNSSKIFSCIGPSANTGPTCIRAKINSPGNFSCMYWLCAGGYASPMFIIIHEVTTFENLKTIHPPKTNHSENLFLANLRGFSNTQTSLGKNQIISRRHADKSSLNLRMVLHAGTFNPFKPGWPESQRTISWAFRSGGPKVPKASKRVKPGNVSLLCLTSQDAFRTSWPCSRRQR